MIRLSGFTLSSAAIMASISIQLSWSSASAQEYQRGALAITHCWSRPSPQIAGAAGGYLIIHNSGETSDRLLSIKARAAGQTKIAQPETSVGTLTMRMPGEGYSIPAHGGVTMNPSPFRLLFEDAKRPPKQGDRVSATLIFENAGPVEVELMVETVGSAALEPIKLDGGQASGARGL